MKYFDSDEGAALRSAFDEIVQDWPSVTSTTMFGCSSSKAEGTLFAALVIDGVALTSSPATTANR